VFFFLFWCLVWGFVFLGGEIFDEGGVRSFAFLERRGGGLFIL